MRNKQNILICFAVALICMTLFASAASATATATRDMNWYVYTGNPLTVELNASDYGTHGQIVETIPDGFIVVSSSLDSTPSAINVTGNVVKLTLFGVSNVNYTVVAPNTTTTGSYFFNGIIKDSNKSTYNVTGEYNLFVVQSAQSSQSVENLQIAQSMYSGGSPLQSASAFDPMDYDLNSNYLIELNEVIKAIDDYFDYQITKDDVIAVINAFFDSDCKYSVTIIEKYNSPKLFELFNLGDLDPHGTQINEKVDYWLNERAHWDNEFTDFDGDVDEDDFGTSNTGYKGLDQANFHLHFGHGVNDIGTELALCGWYPGYNYKDVRAQDVEYKWDQENTWVFLFSCNVLKDYEDWGKALKYSHGIMGFENTITAKPELVDNFFTEAIDKDETIYESFKLATKETYDSGVTARIIADTEDQLYNDHLLGQGIVEPDEYPNDQDIFSESWSC